MTEEKTMQELCEEVLKSCERIKFLTSRDFTFKEYYERYPEMYEGGPSL